MGTCIRGRGVTRESGALCSSRIMSLPFTLQMIGLMLQPVGICVNATNLFGMRQVSIEHHWTTSHRFATRILLRVTDSALILVAMDIMP